MYKRYRRLALVLGLSLLLLLGLGAEQEVFAESRSKRVRTEDRDFDEYYEKNKHLEKLYRPKHLIFTGRVIFTLENTVYGVDKGDYVEHIWERDELFYIPKSYLFEGETEIYTSKGAVVRNEKGLRIGYIDKYNSFRGALQGDKIEVYYGEGKAYINKNFATKGIVNPCRSLGANVRDKKGKKIGYLKPGQRFEGFQGSNNKKNYITINWRGQKGYVQKEYVLIGELERYITDVANVRGLDKVKYLGTIPGGYILEAVIYEHNHRYVALEYKGAKALIGGNRLEQMDNKTYISKGGVTRDKYGRRVGYIAPGQKIEGYRIEDRIYINKLGELRTIDTSRIKLPAIEGRYMAKGAIIRDGKGKKLGYIPEGERLDGKRIGKKIRFIYRGQEAFISEKFTY